MPRAAFRDPSNAVYSAAQCRELDRIAIEEHGIPGIVLMKRAARFAWQTLCERWPVPDQVHVFCGAGNNAGDGYIVAALAAQQNVPVRLIQVGDPDTLKGDAARARDFAYEAGVSMERLRSELQLDRGVVVDALLGTGAQGAPRGDYAAAIEAINTSRLPVLAVDLPSGLNPDTGQSAGACIRAALTTTFIGMKRGLFTGRAPALVGRLEFSTLEVPQTVYDQVPACTHLAELEQARRWLRPREQDAHKGRFGHVLVLGGDLGMGGAALMAAEAAARLGAGLVSVATRPQHCAVFLAHRPELMVRGINNAGELEPLLDRASVIVAGPGLGQSDWSRDLWRAAWNSNLPLVVDADALNIIAEHPAAYSGRPSGWVLTPHPGEAGRLLECTIGQIQVDRFAAVDRLRRRFKATVVLKGAGSLVASAEPDGPVAVADVGNPGMASGGMGDILSGVTGALLAQGLDPDRAAELAVLLHGSAADLAAAEGGERGMLATDLLPHLRKLVNS
ncbi:NAD(P)H-hydrate dehydratase [Gilvimarinus sp. F26214L]|uniref:NAD(P)H-hydrate dehydratase n=1 Tax=Gilvimarinus sp. DZF01 TaxID=3461371 RepID=UPI004045946B